MSADRQFEVTLRASDDRDAQRHFKADVTWTAPGAGQPSTVTLTEVHVRPIPPELRVGTDKWTTVCLWHETTVSAHDQPTARAAAAAPYEWCTPCDDQLTTILTPTTDRPEGTDVR